MLDENTLLVSELDVGTAALYEQQTSVRRMPLERPQRWCMLIVVTGMAQDVLARNTSTFAGGCIAMHSSPMHVLRKDCGMTTRISVFILFVLALVACTTPIEDLRVTSLSPEPDATSVPIEAVMTATFNVSIDEASLDGNFVLSDGGVEVDGTITYDAASRTATFTPDTDLDYATEYTAALSGEVRSAAGARLMGEVAWSFTTEVDPTGEPAVTSVVIDQPDLELAVDDDEQLTVTVTAVGGASEDVLWSSDDDAVVTVSTSGLVSAVGVGTAMVTATSVFDADVSDSISVTVSVVGDASAEAYLRGTYVSMSNLSVVTPDLSSGTRVVGFDVAWDESWRVSGPTWVEATDNWDAVWVFAKYSADGQPWQHATLQTTGHTVPAGAAIDTPSDGKGAFIYRDAPGYGTFSAEGVGLVWDFAVDGVDIASDVALRLFAIEMVYVPAGRFFLGSGFSAPGEFRAGLTAFSPFEVTGQSAITLGNELGSLNWTEGTNTGEPIGETDPSFPTGFEAAYVMKFQLTQGQYVDFLNTLTQAQAANRRFLLPSDLEGVRYRYAIEGFTVGFYDTTLPYLPMNWMSWADGAAYADWAGLRPMTELEYEKAARGANQVPVAGEFAWGSAEPGSAVAVTALLNEGTVDEIPDSEDANVNFGDNDPPNGPVRVGSFAAPGLTRVQAGASFYGLLEMSGNLIERAVNVGTPEGRSFTGLHGDGALDGDGNATVEDWPDTSGIGGGFRGGTHFSGIDSLRISARGDAANVENASVRRGVYGWRAARSAP